MTTDAPLAALIIGGTKGVGRAIALRLARPGAQLFLNYRSDDAAATATAAEATERGAEVHTIRCSLADAAGAQSVIEAVTALTDRLDALVHSAAIPHPGYLMTQDLDEVHEAIEVGGLALLYLVRAAAQLLGSGSTVLFLSGRAVETVLPAYGVLAAAKALGECMVRYLGIECAGHGISVNTLSVGPIDTELYRTVNAFTAPDATGGAPSTPAGRPLTAEDAAEVAAFLISPAATMIRGQTVLVDGGLGTTIRAPRGGS